VVKTNVWGGGVNRSKAEIYFKKHYKTGKITLSGGGCRLSTGRGGVGGFYLPPRGGEDPVHTADISK